MTMIGVISLFAFGLDGFFTTHFASQSEGTHSRTTISMR